MTSWSSRLTSVQAMPLFQRATSILCCPLRSKPVKLQQEVPPLAEEPSEGPQSEFVQPGFVSTRGNALLLHRGHFHLTTPPATIPFCTRVTSGEPTSHPFNQVDLPRENGSGELGHAVLMLGQIRSIHSSVLFTEDYLRGWERTSSFSSRAEVNLD